MRLTDKIFLGLAIFGFSALAFCGIENARYRRQMMTELTEKIDNVSSQTDAAYKDIKLRLDGFEGELDTLLENDETHTKQIEGVNQVIDNLKKTIKDTEDKLNKKIEEVEQAKIEKRKAQEAIQTAVYSAPAYSTPTSGLTPTGGVNNFNGQLETYYNLPMEGVVQTAYNNGIGGEYWIRDDGVKMLGDYVIVACNRDVHPYGSLVETSLGTGISLDTGGFAAGNPYQCDIATAW